MRKREIEEGIKEALTLLPHHVNQYIVGNVPIEIDKIVSIKERYQDRYEEKSGGIIRVGDKYKNLPGAFEIDDKHIDNNHQYWGGFSIDFNDQPMITIDPRARTRKSVVNTVLHEVGHAWLTFRGLKDTEKRANLLASHWLKRKGKDYHKMIKAVE